MMENQGRLKAGGIRGTTGSFEKVLSIRHRAEKKTPRKINDHHRRLSGTEEKG